MYLKDKGVAEIFITPLFYDNDFIRGSTTLYNTSANKLMMIKIQALNKTEPITTG